MNYSMLQREIKNNNLDNINKIIEDKDYKTLKELYNHIKLSNNKNILYRYIAILLNNINYDNEGISFIKEKKYVFKYLDSINYSFNLNKLSDTELSYLSMNKIYKVVLERINNNTFNISSLGIKNLDYLLNIIYKEKYYDILNKLIDDYDFIMVYNKSTISTKNLVKYSRNNFFKEKIITSNKFIKDLYNDPSIANYLSNKEVMYLKNDVSINNLFLSNGIRFDILDKKSIKNILENVDMFKIFPFNTIYEFSETYYDKEDLINNDVFMNIYLDSIDCLKHSNFISNLDKEESSRLLRYNLSDIARLYILLNSKYLYVLLKEKENKDLVYNSNNRDIFKFLDGQTTLSILKTKDNILRDYFDVISKISTNIVVSLKSDKLYEEYLDLCKHKKLNSFQKEYMEEIFGYNSKDKSKHKKSSKVEKIIRVKERSKKEEKVYNNLKEKNIYLDDTLDEYFLNEKNINIKFSVLKYIVRYRSIQADINEILTIKEPADIYMLYKSLDGLNKEMYLPLIVKMIADSIRGKNRKKVGNFKTFLEKKLTLKDWNDIVNYLLYFIPLVPGVIKNNYLKTPTYLYEITNYEKNLLNIQDKTFIKYKLAKEEIYYLLNNYPKKYSFINELNNKYLGNKVYRIKDVYVKVNDIYNDIVNNYNSLIKASNNNLKKENNIYISKNKYTYLLLEESKINSYDKYINYLREINLLNLKIVDKKPLPGLYYGFDNIDKNSLYNHNENVLTISKFVDKEPICYRMPSFILITGEELKEKAMRINATFDNKLKIIMLCKVK